MVTTDVVGAVIDKGPSDWQIFQQDKSGKADIALSGRWGSPSKPPASVAVRIVREDTGTPPAAHLDWRPAKTNHDGTWSAVIKAVPAGGLYRIETLMRNAIERHIESSQRGDTRHFLGVGDLWIIAGQSNSAGYGRGPYLDPPDLSVHVFNNAQRWALASQPLNDSTDTVHLANREHYNSGHSPWLHWARKVSQEMGYPIGLVQTSLGGSSLAMWNPTEPGDHPLYDMMLQVVAASGGKVRGMLWHQGCSDALNVAIAPTYQRRFINAVRAWRKALRSPLLPVLTVQINRALWRDDNLDLGWEILREAQRMAPKLLPGLIVISSLDLKLWDRIHNSPFSNLLLAERAAQAVLGAVYGRDVDYLAPDPVSAKAVGRGKTIEITFCNVTSRMDTTGDPDVVPFSVEDATGVVPVKKVRYAQGAKIRLLLDRPLSGKAVVHGAFGCNPQPVPCDVVRMMPMLGFYGLEVE